MAWVPLACLLTCFLCFDLSSDACRIDNGGCSYQCTTTTDSYHCTCPTGYQLMADGSTCQDKDECQQTGICPGPGQCSNYPGSYRCACPQGYHYDWTENICTDIDECEMGTSSCSQRCHNTQGAYRCGCITGFILQKDNVTCEDVDECSEQPCEFRCINLPGSFTCGCAEGQYYNSTSSSCLPVACVTPYWEEYTLQCGTQEKDMYDYGEVCTLQCKQGVTVGFATVECLSSGDWSPVLADCIVEDRPPSSLSSHIYLSSDIIQENSKRMSFVSWLRTAGFDASPTGVYILLNHTDTFAVHGNGQDAKLLVAGNIDYETKSTYWLGINCSDERLLQTFTDVVIVHVIDMNEPPSFPFILPASLAETAAVGTRVTTFQATDPDRDQNISYRIISGAQKKFEIIGSTLVLKQDLDFEKQEEYVIRIEAKDSGIPSCSTVTTLRVYVTDVNEHPTDILFNSTSVQEFVFGRRMGTINGTVVGTLTAVDADKNDDHTFSLIDHGRNNLECFSVHKSLLVVADVKCFDYEVNSELTFRLQVKDRGNLTKIVIKTISILDQNEWPYQILLSSYEVFQHSPVGGVVGSLSARDPDHGDAHNFTILESDQQFILEGNKLKTNTDLSLVNTPTFEVTIQATDRGGLSYHQLLTIRLMPVSTVVYDPSYYAMILSGMSVAENSEAGEVVGTTGILYNGSIDVRERFECILRDDGKGMFSVQNRRTLVVSGNVNIDYESIHQVQILLECFSISEILRQTFTVAVQNINEPPTNIRSETSRFEVLENQMPGELVAYLVAEDPDEGDQFRFSLESHFTMVPFAIGANHLITHNYINYEVTAYFDITIFVTDIGGLRFSKVVTVTVIDKNDPPTEIVLVDDARISEDATSKTIITTLSTADEDIGQVHTYYIHSQNPEGTLAVHNGNQLVVSNADNINYEEHSSVEVTIVTTDNGLPLSLSHTQTFMIPVLDVNEVPTGIFLSNNTVKEYLAPGTMVAEITVEDPDTVHQVFYCTLICDAGGRFKVQFMPQTQQIYLQVAASALLNYEHSEYHHIEIMCKDSGGLSVNSNFTIQVLDVNDAPSKVICIDSVGHSISFPHPPPQISGQQSSSVVVINETTSAKSVGNGIVAYVGVADADNENRDYHTHTCQIFSETAYSSSNQKGLETQATDKFQLVTINGSAWYALIVVNEIDYEELLTPFDIHFRCTDDDAPTLSAVMGSLKVVINNLPEAPYNLTLSNNRIAENSQPEALVGLLSVFDEDQPPSGYILTIITNGSPFFIRGSELRVLHDRLNYEDNTAVTMQIKAEEVETGLSLIKNFTIDIININEPPCCLKINGQTELDLPENMAVDAEIGTLTVIDEDNGDNHTYSLQHSRMTGEAGEDESFFRLEGNKLYLFRTLDPMSHGLLRISLMVVDTTGLKLIEQLYFRILMISCGGVVCSTDGFCNRNGLPPRCICKLGFIGDGINCTNTGACALSSPCHPDNTLTCVNGHGDGHSDTGHYTCICKQGWMPPRCDLSADHCDGNMCNVNGTSSCVNLGTGYQCVCDIGYTGVYCDVQVDVDDCRPGACQNGGTCQDGIDEYSCVCQPGYKGRHCEIDHTACLSVMCPFNGTCVTLSGPSGGYMCQCSAPYSPDCRGCVHGYGGPACKPCHSQLNGCTKMSICSSSPCQHYSTCVDFGNSSFGCICTGGWTGPTCSISTIKPSTIYTQSESSTQVTGEENEVSTLIYIIAGIIGLLLVVLSVVISIYMVRRKRKKRSSRGRVRFPTADQDSYARSGLRPERRHSFESETNYFVNPVYNNMESTLAINVEVTAGDELVKDIEQSEINSCI